MIETSTIPPDSDRLLALRECAILDSPREAEFDRIVFTASQLCNAPIAALVMVDQARLWCKAHVGLHTNQYPRLHSFCDAAIQTDGLLEVTDTAIDTRFTDSEIVRHEQVRAYAGLRILGPRRCAVGVICVMFRQPRQIDARRRHFLKEMSAQVSVLLLARARFYA